MVIPSTGCSLFPCQEVIEGGVDHDVFDNYVTLKGISGSAIFSYML